MKKNKLVYKNIEALQPIVNVVNEADLALNNKKRTITESAIPNAIFGALGAGVGGTASFGLLYGLGSVGLSAAGITSGLAAAGALVGGGMVAGIFVLATPIAALSVGGVMLSEKLKRKQLVQEKSRLYKEALLKQQAVIEALKEEVNASNERIDYLHGLNILLQKAIEELKQDLALESTVV